MSDGFVAWVYLPFVGAAAVASFIQSLGLSNIVALAIVALGGLVTIKLNIGKTWQANYEAEREARRIAEDKVAAEHEARVKAEHDLRIAEAKTDLTAVLAAQTTAAEKLSTLIEQQSNAQVRQVADALGEHDRRAEERHQGVLAALTEVTNNLADLRQNNH